MSERKRPKTKPVDTPPDRTPLGLQIEQALREAIAHRAAEHNLTKKR